MLTHLASSLSLPIVYIEYSLSPEHPFPAANNDILKVYRELQKKYPGYKITLIGDSAGGTFLRNYAGYYAGSRLKEADASQIKFKKFPPVLLLVGTDEILNDDAKNSMLTSSQYSLQHS